MRAPAAWLPIGLLAVLPPLFWSSNFVLARALHADFPPIALAFWRWAAALAILLPFTWQRLWLHRDALRRHWAALSLLALLGITNYNTFAYLGLQHTTATNGVLLGSATPVLIIATSFLLLGTRVRPRQVAGILVSLIGVVLIATEGRPTQLAALTLNRGDIWILVAAVDWALYSVCLRWRPADLAPAVFLTAVVALGLLPLAGLYSWELASGRGFALNATNITAIGYIALCPSVLAYLFWNRAVQELGPNRTGHYLHLVPAFGVLFSVMLLGERLHAFHLAGALLIGVGIVLATWAVSARTRRQARSR